MDNLDEYRKLAGYQTLKSFSAAMGCSTSKGRTLLQGRHINAISMDEMRRVAGVLKIDVQTCIDAMEESYQQWLATWLKPTHQAPMERQLTPIEIMIDRACKG